MPRDKREDNTTIIADIHCKYFNMAQTQMPDRLKSILNHVRIQRDEERESGRHLLKCLVNLQKNFLKTQID